MLLLHVINFYFSTLSCSSGFILLTVGDFSIFSTQLLCETASSTLLPTEGPSNWKELLPSHRLPMCAWVVCRVFTMQYTVSSDDYCCKLGLFSLVKIAT